MAIYRLEAKVISRAGGRSATAAAAYRAGTEILDERIGERFDYSRRHGVLHTEILSPDNAPGWMRDRAQLWNAVELAEKRKDAQLAREYQLALPWELTDTERLALVRGFVQTAFVDRGLVADVAIHAPHNQGDERNHHAHVMVTMRELTGDGFGKKLRGEWTERKGELEAVREAWADHLNRTLSNAGREDRVDHRSYERQGLDREAEPKMGPTATQMEREGRESHAGRDRRAVRERNHDRAQLEAEGRVINLEEERLKRLQSAEDITGRIDARIDRIEGDALATDPEERSKQETRHREWLRHYQARRGEVETDTLALKAAARLEALKASQAQKAFDEDKARFEAEMQRRRSLSGMVLRLADQVANFLVPGRAKVQAEKRHAEQAAFFRDREHAQSRERDQVAQRLQEEQAAVETTRKSLEEQERARLEAALSRQAPANLENGIQSTPAQPLPHRGLDPAKWRKARDKAEGSAKPPEKPQAVKPLEPKPGLKPSETPAVEPEQKPDADPAQWRKNRIREDEKAREREQDNSPKRSRGRSRRDRDIER